MRHRADDRLRVHAAGRHPDLGVLERPDAGKTGPTIAVLYYRAQHLAGNTGYVEALCRAIEDAGGRPLPLYCASLRTAEPRLLERLGGADAMVVTVLAAGESSRPPPRPAATMTAGTLSTWRRWTSRSCKACV